MLYYEQQKRVPILLHKTGTNQMRALIYTIVDVRVQTTKGLTTQNLASTFQRKLDRNTCLQHLAIFTQNH